MFLGLFAKSVSPWSQKPGTLFSKVKICRGELKTSGLHGTSSISKKQECLIGLVRFLQMPPQRPVPTKGPPRQLCQGPWLTGHGPWQSLLSIGPSLPLDVEEASAGNGRVQSSIPTFFGTEEVLKFLPPMPFPVMGYLSKVTWYRDWLLVQCKICSNPLKDAMILISQISFQLRKPSGT